MRKRTYWKTVYCLIIFTLTAPAMLGCQPLPTPVVGNSDLPATEQAVAQPAVVLTPVPLREPEPTLPPAHVVRPAPTIPPVTRPSMPFRSGESSTATPASTPTHVPAPSPTPSPTLAPTPTLVPTAVPAPTATATPDPALNPEPTGQPLPISTGALAARNPELDAQLAEFGASLKWIAHFDDDLKSWFAYDPAGTFAEDSKQLPIPVTFPVSELTGLVVGNVYFVGLSEDSTFRGKTLLSGINVIVWPSDSQSDTQPPATKTPAPDPTRQAHDDGSPGENLEIVEQLAGLGTALKWAAYLYDENGSWYLSLYDPTGTFPGLNALIPIDEEVPISQLTRLVEGREYLIAVSRDMEFRGMQFTALGSGINVGKWRGP